MKTAVVTGASTGIGWATCKILIQNGFRVFGGVRKDADGARLASEFGEHFTALRFDITDLEAVAAAATTVRQALAGQTLSALVNNAGIAVTGPLLYLAPQALQTQLKVNVEGPLVVTQAFAPLLGTDKSLGGSPGRIVMISSVAGTSATPFMGAYNASKFALEGMSEALRRELMLFGIDVIVVAPGPVKTPIWRKGAGITQSYDNTPYGAVAKKLAAIMRSRADKGLEPEDVGRAILKAITTAKPRTRYVLSPEPLRHLMINYFPKRVVDRIFAKNLGLNP